MAYDETLASRIRDVLASTPGVSERKMFGGLAFLIDGRMCCGVVERSDARLALAARLRVHLRLEHRHEV